MPLLGKYRLSFDTWRLLEIEDDYLEESEEIGDPDIETDTWEPVKGTPCEDISVVFVDGVRRTENLIYLEDEDGSFSEGAFVSVGAGALLMRYGRTNPAHESFQNLTVKRYLFVKKDVDLQERIIRFDVGDSKLEFFVEKSKKELSPYVNEVMARIEASVAEAVYRRVKPDLMITDGTVHYSTKVKELPFVGYVKKHRRIYIPNNRVGIFREMQVGDRTPIVLIHSQPTMEGQGAKSFDKFTWYVRISEDEGISGIARLEIPASIGLKNVIEIANRTAWLIPKFASSGFNERRAPQNLLPIKYLENTLRRRLGSQALIRRIIMKEMFTS